MQIATIFHLCSLVWFSRLLHLGGIVCTLGIVVVGWQMRQHLRKQAAAAENLCSQELATISARNQSRAHLETLKAELKSCQAAVEQLSGKLVRGPQESRFIAQLGLLAEERGIEIRNFRPGRLTHRGSLDELELQLSCEGTYEGLCSFLAAQENSPRFSHVAALNIASQPTGEVLHFDLSFQLLFQKSVSNRSEEKK